MSNSQQKKVGTALKPYLSDTFPAFEANTTASKILDFLSESALDFESINYVYQVTKAGKLNGVASLKEILVAPKSKHLGDISNPNVITARKSSSPGRVAGLALEHNIKEIPIVDKDNKILGIISADDIMDIIYEELQNDLFHLSGLPDAETSFSKPSINNMWHSFVSRVPWLIIGLFGGMVTARAIGAFDNLLEGKIILVAFIPLVVYLAGAVSTQLQAIVIRDLALRTTKFQFGRYVKLQLGVLLLLAVVVGAILGLVSYILYQDFLLSATLNLAVSFAIMTTIFTGGMMPLILDKLGQDPADASGPLATVIQDLLSVVIYLAVAGWVL